MRDKGQGSVYEKDGKWVARLRWTDDAGRRFEKSFKSDTKAGVKSKLKAFQKDLAKGDAVLGKELRLGEWLNRAMDEIYRPKLRPSTFVQYRGIIDNHLKELLDVRMSRLTVEMVEQAIAARPVGARTKGLIRRFLIGAINHAVRRGVVSRNVAALTLPAKGEVRRVTGLGIEEARAILAHTKNPTYRAAFLWQMRLGLRLGEVLGIRHEDIEGDVVHIRRQVQRNRLTGKLELSPLKTDKAARTLPLSKDLIEALATVPRIGEFAFPSEVGGAIEPRNYQRNLDVAAKAAGLGHVATHRLRHSYASWLVGSGVDIAVISKAMGHSQISVTMVYAQAATEAIRAANDCMPRLT